MRREYHRESWRTGGGSPVKEVVDVRKYESYVLYLVPNVQNTAVYFVFEFQNMNNLPLAVPSALLCAMYFVSGLGKFTKLGKVAEELRTRTFDAPLWVFVAVICVSSCMLVLTSSTIVYSSVTKRSRKWAMYSALYLVAFTVLATLLYHWPPTGSRYYPFVSNVTACGGLLLLATRFA